MTNDQEPGSAAARVLFGQLWLQHLYGMSDLKGVLVGCPIRLGLILNVFEIKSA